MAPTQSPTAFGGKAGTTVCSKLGELSLNASKGEPKESAGTAKEGFASTTPSKRDGKLKSSSPSPKMGYTPLKFKHMPGQDPTPSPKTRTMMMELLAEIGDPTNPNQAWKEKAQNKFGFESCGASQPPSSFPKPSGGDWPPLPDSPFSDDDL